MGDWLGLAGRVCVVTGAASGIGREVALELTREGAVVAALDVDEAGLVDTVAAAQGLGPPVLPVRCDVTDQAGVTAAAGTVAAQLGPCAVLVNNAGLARPAPLLDVSLADWELPLRINLTGALLCAQTFAKPMHAAGRGSVLHVASISGSQPIATNGAYSPSKSALLMLSRQLAAEWGPAGIRSRATRREAAVPLRRIGKASDIVGAVAFLVSDRAGYITGQEIVCDGGLSQTLMSHVPR